MLVDRGCDLWLANLIGLLLSGRIEKENGYPSADGDEEDDNELENGDDGLKGLFWQF